ncbi:MAG TPA: protease pro-enzyme activation domain-containing protein [Thermoplasmata archaeon]|nr:protease pro-enzyme activation domain-containing protein [Thermoplasmata archaeon]
MHRHAWALGPIITILVVTGTAATAVGSASPGSAPFARSASLLTDVSAVPASAVVRALPSATPVSLTFTLTNPHAAALTEFLAQVENPWSLEYRQFLSYQQFVEQFSPPVSSVALVESDLIAAGAHDITSTPDRAGVSAVMSAGAVRELLNVELVTYGSLDGLPLYTALGTPTLPAGLQGVVAGIGGLSDAATAELDQEAVHSAHPVPEHPLRASEFARDNDTGEDWYVGSDYTQAFGAVHLFPGTGSVANATYPTSVAIATLLVSGYNETAQGNLPPWDPAVINAYFNGTLAPGWPMPKFTGVPVTVDGTTPPLPGSYGSENDSTPYETENSLDLEMAGSLAPGSSLYNFYFAASVLTGSATTGDAADYFATDLAEALAWPYSPSHLAAVSCSFGLPDLDDSLWDAELITAAATGVTIVAASGDQGNAPDSLTGRSDGQWPVWPASDASTLAGAVSVGGVTLSLSGEPSMYYNNTPLNLTYDPNAGAITSLSAWYDTSSGAGLYAGTEGGVSSVFSEPSWQFDSAAQPNIVNATVLEGASTLGRSGPDVAMPANATLATVSANATETIFFEILEGTSIAAPVFAGVVGDVAAVDTNRSAGTWTPLGFIDPALYRFGSFFAAHPGAPADPYLDVVNGSNYVFSAMPGWDATTGWGCVSTPLLLDAFNNHTLLSFVYTGPTPGLPVVPPSSTGNIPWPVIYAIFGVGIVVAIVLVLYAARPSRPPTSPTGVPWGVTGGPASLPPAPPGTYPGATYLCPFCGAIRPSEPVRCPQCGAL